MDSAQQDQQPELSLVSSARALRVKGGIVPSGSMGTAVHVSPGEPAHEIEFTRSE